MEKENPRKNTINLLASASYFSESQEAKLYKVGPYQL